MMKRLLFLTIIVFVPIYLWSGKLVKAQNDYIPNVTSGPSINDTYVSSFQVVVNWVTDLPTTSYVAYSETDGGFDSVDPAAWGTWRTNISLSDTVHKVFIGGLKPDTTYYYRISGFDSQGRQLYTNPPRGTFRTHPAPSITTNPTVSNIKENEATISWTTNYKTTSTIAYGTDSTLFGSSNPEQWGTTRYSTNRPAQQNNLDYANNFSEMTMVRSIRIGGLSPNTTYYFRVTGKDYPYVGSYTNFPEVMSFTTTSAPTPTATPVPVEPNNAISAGGVEEIKLGNVTVGYRTLLQLYYDTSFIPSTSFPNASGVSDGASCSIKITGFNPDTDSRATVQSNLNSNGNKCLTGAVATDYFRFAATAFGQKRKLAAIFHNNMAMNNTSTPGTYWSNIVETLGSGFVVPVPPVDKPTWASYLGTNNADLDYVSDGVVNGKDYALWLRAGGSL